MSNESSQVVIGIIGGSGLYDMGDKLTIVDTVSLDTPYGKPSDDYIVATTGNVKAIFLPRHGKNHTILPHEINFRANMWGFKKLGATHVISVSAVGSMKEELKPGHVVLVDQFYDRTKGRPSTMFGDGCVVHVEFADPICSNLQDIIYEAAKETEAVVHKNGTYICINGPQFSTRGESNIYRQWGVDVIGMTNIPEAKLARESEICYATMALVTDYDCWHESEEDVTVDEVIRVLKENVSTAKSIILNTLSKIPDQRTCKCENALQNGVMTPYNHLSDDVKEKYAILLKKYLK